MAVNIRESGYAGNYPFKIYDVTLDDTEITTVVTHNPRAVRKWIKFTETLNEYRLHRLIVGLDIEWHPNFNSQNPVATLQLCVGTFCLIYQILHSPCIPRRLREFLKNEDYRFVGVGIDDDVKKLWNDYGLEVTNTVDLREWAAELLDKKNLRKAGLKDLVKEIEGVEIKKPKSVTMSAWDQRCLSHKQICYACLDAFLSFHVGKRLSSKARKNSKRGPQLLCLTPFML